MTCRVTIESYPELDSEARIVAVFDAHWNWSNRVIVTIGGEKHTFMIGDIERALRAVSAAKR